MCGSTAKQGVGQIFWKKRLNCDLAYIGICISTAILCYSNYDMIISSLPIRVQGVAALENTRRKEKDTPHGWMLHSHMKSRYETKTHFFGMLMEYFPVY